MAAARLLGASCIFAAGRNPAALERCRSLGADATVNLHDTPHLTAARLQATGGTLDIVLDYLCDPLVEAALDALGKHGAERDGAPTVAVLKDNGTVLAKTTRPELGSVLPREALFKKLDGTPVRTLAWIAGPAGSGKSTLAASYLTQ